MERSVTHHNTSGIGANVRGTLRGREGRSVGLLMAAVGAGLFAGCEADSYLMDPSVLGRWEHTPTRVPILDRLGSIEGADDELIEHSEPTAADLKPVVDQYRIGPGDMLLVVVWDIPVQRQATPYELEVDARGVIDIPEVGQVYAAGRTAEEVRDAVATAMRQQELVANPLVSVVVRLARQKSYTIVGAVASPGPYFIPTAEFRLIEALATAGGFSESTPFIYVIRQVALSDEATGRVAPPAERTGQPQPTTPDGEDLLKYIDELTQPPRGGSPGMMAAGSRVGRRGVGDSEIGLMGWQPGTREGPGLEASPGEATWVYINGEWVPVQAERVPSVIGSEDETRLMTQRVIRIRTKDLVSGDARYNIVVRPGDVIRLPPPPFGNFFMMGQISRPGAFQLSQDITLLRGISSAGGLGSLAYPQRVDLTRMVGTDSQATIRLNLRAIAEGTQPDIYLKANDLINIGTSFWSFPMAVVRNGFRATYGFGFLLDRNFGNDVFGAPPVRRIGE